MKVLKWIAIVVAALLTVAVTILVVLGHLPNADRFQASTEINASPDKVWIWIDDGQKMKQWVSWLVDVKQSGPSGVGVNRTFVMKDENNGGMLMRLETRCTEYVPKSRLSVALTAPEYQFDGSQSYRLTDLGNGKTRLDINGQYHFSQWFASLMSPLVMPAAKSKLVGDMAHLKALAEAS